MAYHLTVQRACLGGLVDKASAHRGQVCWFDHFCTHELKLRTQVGGSLHTKISYARRRFRTQVYVRMQVGGSISGMSYQKMLRIIYMHASTFARKHLRTTHTGWRFVKPKNVTHFRTHADTYARKSEVRSPDAFYQKMSSKQALTHAFMYAGTYDIKASGKKTLNSFYEPYKCLKV